MHFFPFSNENVNFRNEEKKDCNKNKVILNKKNLQVLYALI